MPAKKSQKQTLDIKKLAELVGRELNEPTQGMTNETKNIPPIPLKEPDTIRPTGIKELDQMLKGGFPNNAIVLVAGSSGCGKTILSMQWLMEGYRNFQDPGLYISLTEPINKMIRSSKNLSFFGW